jgi:TPR repeat protein
MLLFFQAVLGFCYEFGLGVEQDYKAAEQLYISAAHKGSSLATLQLSFIRRYGRPSVKIDRVEAEEWIRKLDAVSGSKAVEWLTMAADGYNHPAGMCAV